MKRIHGALSAALLISCFGLGGSGCTWVPLTPEGEQIRVLEPESIGECERLGRTRSRTGTAVGPFRRKGSKVLEEQTSLARNEAARMGGNAISIEGPPEDGEQVFGVYRCNGGS
jgi:hypothetical protein